MVTGKLVVVTPENGYVANLMRALAKVPPPTLPQLLRDGDELMDRVRMPPADPDSVDVPDDVEPGE